MPLGHCDSWREKRERVPASIDTCVFLFFTDTSKYCNFGTSQWDFGSMLNLGHTAFHHNRSVDLTCLFGMGQYSFLATPVVNKQELPKDRRKQPINESPSSPHAVSSFSVLSFTLVQVCSYFWQQRADANTHPSASSQRELPPPHCHLSIVPAHWVRIKSKHSLASSKLIMDKESSRSSRWCAMLQCSISADLCCVGLVGWPPCWRGVRADCMPGFLHLLSCFGVMGRPAGGVVVEICVSSTVGSGVIRPCCDGPQGRDESRWGVTAEIRWRQSSGVAVIRCSLNAQRYSLW